MNNSYLKANMPVVNVDLSDLSHRDEGKIDTRYFEAQPIASEEHHLTLEQKRIRFIESLDWRDKEILSRKSEGHKPPRITFETGIPVHVVRNRIRALKAKASTYFGVAYA
jgi:hypothetical protein